ncbi:photosystem II 5 kDa protein, chloroplastic [Solanum lycopersicum]|uniref:Photosystem II 5 kDa protein, chloroplastic n=1 Tax=Solanum lycopersicum TaxID=4081 RepID=A0A3Q7JFN4_SOLLC|nr:photosystem II 5 kDa protein, chloroplastic [Solanum lycopersicum]
MASMTMTTSLAGGSIAALTKAPAATRGARVVMVKASSHVSEGENVVMSNKKEINNNNGGRRELFFAMAAAAACSVAGAAMADDEPKRGSPEAKKKYFQVCVSNPTARICRNAT